MASSLNFSSSVEIRQDQFCSFFVLCTCDTDSLQNLVWLFTVLTFPSFGFCCTLLYFICDTSLKGKTVPLHSGWCGSLQISVYFVFHNCNTTYYITQPSLLCMISSSNDSKNAFAKRITSGTLIINCNSNMNTDSYIIHLQLRVQKYIRPDI